MNGSYALKSEDENWLSKKPEARTSSGSTYEICGIKTTT